MTSAKKVSKKQTTNHGENSTPAELQTTEKTSSGPAEFSTCKTAPSSWGNGSTQVTNTTNATTLEITVDWLDGEYKEPWQPWIERRKQIKQTVPLNSIVKRSIIACISGPDGLSYLIKR